MDDRIGMYLAVIPYLAEFLYDRASVDDCASADGRAGADACARAHMDIGSEARFRMHAGALMDALARKCRTVGPEQSGCQRPSQVGISHYQLGAGQLRPLFFHYHSGCTGVFKVCLVLCV